MKYLVVDNGHVIFFLAYSSVILFICTAKLFLHKLFDSEMNKEQECQSSHKTYELQIYIIYK